MRFWEIVLLVYFRCEIVIVFSFFSYRLRSLLQFHPFDCLFYFPSSFLLLLCVHLPKEAETTPRTRKKKWIQ